MNREKILNWKNRVKSSSMFYIYSDERRPGNLGILEAKIRGQYFEHLEKENYERQKMEIEHKNKNIDRHYEIMEKLAREMEKIQQSLAILEEIVGG